MSYWTILIILKVPDNLPKYFASLIIIIMKKNRKKTTTLAICIRWLAHPILLTKKVRSRAFNMYGFNRLNLNDKTKIKIENDNTEKFNSQFLMPNGHKNQMKYQYSFTDAIALDDFSSTSDFKVVLICSSGCFGFD